jgi:hypothetical protein
MVQPAEEDGQKGEDTSPGNRAQLVFNSGSSWNQCCGSAVHLQMTGWQRHPAVSIGKEEDTMSMLNLVWHRLGFVESA